MLIMARRFYHFGILSSLIVGVALFPAVANATITVLNNWNMGESDPGPPVNGNNATTVVDNVGSWNMTATTANCATSSRLHDVAATYVSPGAYTGSSLAMSFTNADSATVRDAVLQ